MQTAAISIVVATLTITSAFAQVATASPMQKDELEQLDQMLAPVALYPDPLLAELLMAATYPHEVTQADRWIREQKSGTRGDDRLTKALELQTWDPSVKSLVPFGRVLRMMDDQPEWTKHVGDAVLTDQAAVLESIQRLRRRAQAAGNLTTTSQATVTITDGVTTIEPPQFGTVYIPVYDPAAAYGTWPDPDHPPSSFPATFHDIVKDERGLGWLSAKVAPAFRNWNRIVWARHNIFVDPDRFAAINDNKPPPGNGIWRHDPSHRSSPAEQAATAQTRIDADSSVLRARDYPGVVPADMPEQAYPPAQGYDPALGMPGFDGMPAGYGNGFRRDFGERPGAPGFHEFSNLPPGPQRQVLPNAPFAPRPFFNAGSRFFNRSASRATGLGGRR